MGWCGGEWGAAKINFLGRTQRRLESTEPARRPCLEAGAWGRGIAVRYAGDRALDGRWLTTRSMARATPLCLLKLWEK